MSKGCDYAMRGDLSRPSTAALEAAGITFVGRYVSRQAYNDTNGKNLVPAELGRLKAAGLSVILYDEQAEANRMLGGGPAGEEDAEHFAAVTKALGLGGIVMYAAADWDATPAQQVPINAYLDAVAARLGRARTGIYGGFWPVHRALNAGKASWACQTYAWSRLPAGFALPAHAVKVTIAGYTYLFDDRVHIRQGPYVWIGGVQCDQLTSMRADFGQWPRPVTGLRRMEITARTALTLWDVAAAAKVSVQRIWDLSLPHLTVANRNIFTNYLAMDASLTDAGHPHPVLPIGFVCWRPA